MKRIHAFVVLVICLGLILSGCSFQKPVDKVQPSETGKVVMTFVRNAGPSGSKGLAQVTGFYGDVNTKEITQWQRTKEWAAANVEGYKLRIQGTNVELFKEIRFAKGETSKTIEVSLPIGSGYTFKVLAFGVNNQLLGAGINSGVSISSEPNIIAIPMTQYQYSFEGTDSKVSTAVESNVKVAVKGPFISEVVNGWGSVGYTFVPDDLASNSISGGRTSYSPIFSGDMVTYDIKLPGQPSSGAIKYYANMSVKSEWTGDGTYLHFYFPYDGLGESLPQILIESAGTSTVVQPTW